MKIGIIDLIPVFSQLAESIHVLNEIDIHVNPLCVLVLFITAPSDVVLTIVLAESSRMVPVPQLSKQSKPQRLVT